MLINSLLFVSLGVVAVVILAKILLPWIRKAKLNKGLALYPLHSSNLFIILDKNNQVVFMNTTATGFIKELGYPGNDPKSLLPKNLVDYQNSALADEKQQHFEFKINQHTFDCELLWHANAKQWNINMVNISSRKLEEQKRDSQAQINPDTGLDNHYVFKQVIEQMVDQRLTFTVGQIEIRSYSKLLADNDFETSRKVMKELSDLLQGTCVEKHQNVRLFQLTEKSFGLVFQKSNCHATVKQIVATINNQVKNQLFSGQHSVKLDYGFTSFPSDGKSADEIIRNTRIALENSASQEFTDYMMFSNELGKSVERQNSLQDAMRSAIVDNHFQLFFQPQYSLKEKRIIGAEVLIRWQLDEQWISPSEFIPLAEHSGLILPLGDWILTSVCQKAQHIVAMGFEDIVIAVNISPKQFSAPNFVKMVKRALLSSGLAAKNLELEITEGVLFNKEADTINTLNQLNQMGIKLAIDDFGTGYSSLSYLQVFPVTKLKIDQSFVRNMHLNKADKSIVRSVIELGNELGVTLIAEGVEESEQVDLLTQMGCDEIQGYWLSKPLDESYFSHFLHSNKLLS
ncbi:EAL domain-containing protein [Aliiglaciecola sp. 2_MG-2023]|uniref:putative bifunctional diguanylate cyclase/phosphodiesterase n=1 Tax=unclassified Aliiglaciecola TaxID=2593648 RepID=UPI0026E22C90|nr:MULTISPECIES: EAL domain-containing protein [unclassified Aliiglaciecola]MDO6709436.1 EAL domain-containing protein [Aliiglaciecola sp. 2_MG-2023]MDO6750584.1 EAL domain-containing protein [Aliiglaciecola sp. 1_MG-2023]